MASSDVSNGMMDGFMSSGSTLEPGETGGNSNGMLAIGFNAGRLPEAFGAAAAATAAAALICCKADRCGSISVDENCSSFSVSGFWAAAASSISVKV